MKMSRFVSCWLTWCFCIVNVFELSAQSVIPLAVPESAAVLEMVRETPFARRAIVTGPTLIQGVTENSQFRLSVYFGPQTVNLDPKHGAIAAKLEIAGIPERFNIPAGTYFLWMGRQQETTIAALLRPDGKLQRELPVYRQHFPTQAAARRARAVVAGSQLPPGGTIGPGRPPLDHGPPRTYKWITRRVCYYTNHHRQCEDETIVVPDA